MNQYENFLYNVASTMPDRDAHYLLFSHRYVESCKEGVYVPCNDLINQQQRERYNKYINLITLKNISPFYLESFKKGNREEIFFIFIYIVVTIFGESDSISDELKVFLSGIIENGSNEVLDGVTSKLINTNTKDILYITQIPSVTNYSAIVCLFHEFVHFHFQKNDSLCSVFHRGEILSILGEKIASYFVDKQNVDDKFSYKIDIDRLECIKWHYTKKLNELNMLKMFSKETFNPNMKRLYEEYIKYFIDLAQSYGIGFLYAENLFQIFLDDPKEFTKNLRKVLLFEQSINDMLEHYDISTNNKKTFDNAKIKIKTLLK